MDKDRRQMLREQASGVTLENAVGWSPASCVWAARQILDLLDALAETEAERDEARRMLHRLDDLGTPDWLGSKSELERWFDAYLQAREADDE
jgi:hypothetical protein